MSRTRTTRTLRLAAFAAGLALVASACGVTSDGDSGTAADAAKPMTDLRLMVPNTPGGGYDTTARVAAKVMEDADITHGTEVFNLDGAGGTVGLARTVNEKGNGDLAMMMGLGVVGASYTNKSQATLKETTPIVRLIEEYGAVMVSKDSPFKTIDDLVTAWKKDPKGISVGGGSSPGGPDHLLPMQLAQAVGIDPRDVNFVQYDGGGDLLPAILGDASWPPAATSGPRASTLPRSRSRASTWSSPTGAASWRPRASATCRRTGSSTPSRRCTTPRSGRTRWSPTAGPTRS